MSVCKCYRYEMNFFHEGGVCYGTKEREPCSCGGDESKCDFYPDKRQKQTNADRIRAMSDEEISEWFWWMLDYTKQYTDSRLALRDWLKKEAINEHL